MSQSPQAHSDFELNRPWRARSARLVQGLYMRQRLAGGLIACLALTMNALAMNAWAQSPNIRIETDWWDKQRKAYPDCTAEVNRHQAADEQLKALSRQRPPDAEAINAASEKRTTAYYEFIRCVQSKPRPVVGWQTGTGGNAVYTASNGSRWSFLSVLDRPPSRWILQRASIQENMQHDVLMGVNAEYIDAHGHFPPMRLEGHLLPRR